MAKPEHTAYQVLADFSKLNTDDYIVTHTVPVGLDTSCIQGPGGNIKVQNRFGKQNHDMSFTAPEDAFVSFGFTHADNLLQQARHFAKKQFKKGHRPTFFLRKMTMSEFMAHKEFKKYRTSNATVQNVFKKYLLLEDLRDGGFQHVE
jgi:hypothetical protein